MQKSSEEKKDEKVLGEDKAQLHNYQIQLHNVAESTMKI